jgi:hypothetical protein
MSKRRWILAALISAILIAIPYALFSAILLTSWIGLILILIIPLLEGLLVWLLLNWRAVYELWGTEKTLVSSLLIALLLVLASTALGNIWITLMVTLPALFTALVWVVGNRIGLGGLAAIGIVLAVFLILYAIGLTGNRVVFNTPGLQVIHGLTSGLGILLALVVAGVCVYRALAEPPVGKHHQAVYLTLAGLLVLCVGAAFLRNGLLTNATGRAMEDHFPVAAFIGGIMIGLVLVLSLKGQARWGGVAFLITTSIVITASFLSGWLFDPRSITTARAMDIQQAIEEYQRDTGEYPPALKALFPKYQLILLGPLTGHGQAWCYQAGSDYYRLGYIFFEAYHQYDDGTPSYESYFEIKVPASAGQPPESGWICDSELERYRLRGGL